MSRLHWLLAGTIIAAATIGAGMALRITSQSGSDQQLKGIIVDVQSRDIVHAETVTVRDATGALHVFRVSPEVANNPEKPASAAHLRQHLTGAIPVVVHYQNTPLGPLALRILDIESPTMQ